MPRRQFNRQWTKRLGDTELRFESPAVGAEVYELLRIILPNRSCHRETYTYDSVLLVTHEVFEREGRSAEEVHIEAEPRIGKTGNSSAPGLP